MEMKSPREVLVGMDRMKKITVEVTGEMTEVMVVETIEVMEGEMIEVMVEEMIGMETTEGEVVVMVGGTTIDLTTTKIMKITPNCLLEVLLEMSRKINLEMYSGNLEKLQIQSF